MQIKSLDTHVGERIERLRRKYGYSRESLAEEIGVTWQHLANIEKGRRKLTTDLLIHLRDIFSVPADYIISGNESPNDISDLTAVLSGVDHELYPFVEESVLAVIKAIRKAQEKESD